MTHPFHQHDATFATSIELLVQNFTLMTQWYEQFLGLISKTKTEDHAAYTINGQDIVLELRSHNKVQAKQDSLGLYHFALLFPTRESLGHVFRHLALLRQPFTGFADHGVSEAIYLSDPEGNGIELYVDKPQDQWPRNESGELQMVTNPLHYEELLNIAPQEKFQNIDPKTILGHLHLHVISLEQSNQFFLEVLKLDLIQHVAKSANFASSKFYHHHIAYNTWLKSKTLRQPNEIGLIGYKVALPKEQLEAVLAAAKEQGIPVQLNALQQPQLLDPNGCVVTLLAN